MGSWLPTQPLPILAQNGRGGNMKEKEVYRERIIQMVREIKDADSLQMIYSFITSFISEKEKQRLD